MHIPKKYFLDRTVLLLLSVTVFLALLSVLLVLLRLDVGQPDGYIIEYRSNLGLSAFKSGGSGTFIGFVLFSLLILVFHSVLSMRVYQINRRFAIVVLALGVLLLLFALVVSNALLVLR